MTARARDLDTVKFLKHVDGWPAGTVGVVIAEDPDSALIEVVTDDQVDEEGFPLRDLFEDLVDVAYEDLEVLSSVEDDARASTSAAE
jgi:hypothetical protein